jgi:hypothetical protein
MFRLYLAPTLTLGMGMAFCFGNYGVSVKLPKPFRDIAGNCLVFALPAPSICTNKKNTDNANSSSTTPAPDIVNDAYVQAAGNGTCNNPAQVSSTVARRTSNNSDTTLVIRPTSSSPFQIVAIGENNTPKPIIPQGNF